MGEAIKVTSQPQVFDAFQVTRAMCRGEEKIPFDDVKRKEGYEYLLAPHRKVPEMEARVGIWLIRQPDGFYQWCTEEAFKRGYIPVSPVPTTHAHFPAQQLELPFDSQT